MKLIRLSIQRHKNNFCNYKLTLIGYLMYNGQFFEHNKNNYYSIIRHFDRMRKILNFTQVENMVQQ